MNTHRPKISLYHLVVFIICMLLGFYGFSKYKILESQVDAIDIKFNEEITKENTPIVFIAKDSDSEVDLKTPIKYKSFKDSVLNFQFDPEDIIRKARIYFVKTHDTLSIKSITISSSSDTIVVPFKKAKSRGIGIQENLDTYDIIVYEKYGFLELPSSYIYHSDFKKGYVLVGILFVFMVFALQMIRLLKPCRIQLTSISDFTIVIFLLSIFLPHPIFNIALVLLLAFNLRKISWRKIKENRMNLLFLSFFLVYLLNNLFIAKEGYHEMSTIDRFLPILILGLVIPAIAQRKHLVLFVYASFGLGFWFLLTSTFDILVHGNFNFLSFDLFTKYLHPIYFSYLLFFSILYLETESAGIKKYILQSILLVFLVFSGSKMVLVASLLLMGFKFLRYKRQILLLIPVVFVVLLFSPLKERFKEILNQEDFSILSEHKISEPNDARVNGLTLRLMLWREAISTMNKEDFILGKGVARGTDKILEEELIALGLTHHKNYNTHNQLIDTFWKTGIFGLLILIMIIILGITQGIKTRDHLISIFSTFVLFFLLSECVFERVNGIYFFTTTLLFLANSLSEKKRNLSGNKL